MVDEDDQFYQAFKAGWAALQEVYRKFDVGSVQVVKESAVWDLYQEWLNEVDE